MRYLVWFVRVALFLFLFAFTLKNTTPVVLFGLLDAHWQAPLVVFLLIFFIAGTLLGVCAMLPPYLRVRRELAQVRKQLKPVAEKAAPVSPDLIEPAAPLDAVI